jgi:hypothetical protein
VHDVLNIFNFSNYCTAITTDPARLQTPTQHFYSVTQSSEEHQNHNLFGLIGVEHHRFLEAIVTFWWGLFEQTALILRRVNELFGFELEDKPVDIYCSLYDSYVDFTLWGGAA